MNKPDTIASGYGERKIAQKKIDDTHVLRVIFEEKKDAKRIITIYPGRIKRYEN